MIRLHDGFGIDPETALRMPYRRFLALQEALRRRSIEDMNAAKRREFEANR